MLGRLKDQGPTVICDICQRPIVDNTGLALWSSIDARPQQPITATHKGCLSSSLVHTFLPRGYRQQPLSQYLATVLEGLYV